MAAKAMRSLIIALALAGCAAQTPRPNTPIEVPRIMSSKTVLFVHGMFVTPACWKNWEQYFQARGYRTLAPAWPEHDSPATAQRAKHPNSALAKLTLDDVLEHYRKIIKTLPEKPILIGHSMGGLVVQVLLSEGLGAAGVAIDSAPPKGVITLKWSFLKSNWPALDPFASLDKPILLDERAFSYAFVNTLPPEQQKRAYEEDSMPESRRVAKGPTTPAGKIDFAKARPPLLIVAGERDHIIPATLNRKNFEKYRGPSVTEFKQFAGRDHWIIASDGWQEVADYVSGWIDRLKEKP
jgi:pimeloyl-ACP methyl ester carboxylesterase